MNFDNGSNRIDKAIGRQQGRIDALIKSGVDLKGNPIGASLENMENTMALTVKDHVDFQNQQVGANAVGKLNSDEALTIYNALGEYHNDAYGGWQDGVTLATKVIVTQVVAEFLKHQIA